MIDSIDMINILETVVQPNIKMILILVVLIILATQHLETNTIIIFSILIYIFIYYRQIKETFVEIKEGEKKNRKNC